MAASDAVSKIMKISIVDFIPIVGDMKMYEEIKTVLNGTTVKEAAQLAATQKAHDIIKAWPDSDQQKQTLAMAKGIQMKILSGSFRAGLICCLKDNLSNEEGYEKIFSFLSTRNNNFSNRAQKWQVRLTSQPDAT